MPIKAIEIYIPDNGNCLQCNGLKKGINMGTRVSHDYCIVFGEYIVSAIYKYQNETIPRQKGCYACCLFLEKNRESYNDSKVCV